MLPHTAKIIQLNYCWVTHLRHHNSESFPKSNWDKLHKSNTTSRSACCSLTVSYVPQVRDRAGEREKDGLGGEGRFGSVCFNTEAQMEVTALLFTIKGRGQGAGPGATETHTHTCTDTHTHTLTQKGSRKVPLNSSWGLLNQYAKLKISLHTRLEK